MLQGKNIALRKQYIDKKLPEKLFSGSFILCCYMHGICVPISICPHDGELSIAYRTFHVLRDSSTKMGKISSRPASMAMDRITLEKSL